MFLLVCLSLIEAFQGQRNPLTAEMSSEIWLKSSLLTTVILRNIAIYCPNSTFLYFLVKVLLRCHLKYGKIFLTEREVS